MERKIKYKPISKDLERLAKPAFNAHLRSSLGFENVVKEFFYLPVVDLIPFHNQARKIFDETEITSLSESIKEYGIRQPLTVIKGGNKYEVISGERRLKAAIMAGLEKVPCIIIEENNSADAIALIENIHRSDLHPIELGRSYVNLINKGIFANQSELAKRLHINKSQISEFIKFCDIDIMYQNYILDNKIFSRDKLRAVLKAHNNKDEIKIKKLLGIDSDHNRNFSIIRISCDNNNNIKIQDKGLNKVSKKDREILKEYFLGLIQKL